MKRKCIKSYWKCLAHYLYINLSIRISTSIYPFKSWPFPQSDRHSSTSIYITLPILHTSYLSAYLSLKLPVPWIRTFSSISSYLQKLKNKAKPLLATLVYSLCLAISESTYHQSAYHPAYLSLIVTMPHSVYPSCEISIIHLFNYVHLLNITFNTIMSTILCTYYQFSYYFNSLPIPHCDYPSLCLSLMTDLHYHSVYLIPYAKHNMSTIFMYLPFIQSTYPSLCISWHMFNLHIPSPMAFMGASSLTNRSSSYSKALNGSLY